MLKKHLVLLALLGFTIQKTIPAKNIEVEVKTLTGKSIQISLSKDESLKVLHAMIQNKLGIPLLQQRLIFDGKQMKILNNKLSDYGIKDKSSIHFLEQMSAKEDVIIVQVKMDSSEESIEVKTAKEDTVADLMKLLEYDKLDFQGKKLMFKGKELEASQTLATYGMTSGSMVKVVKKTDDEDDKQGEDKINVIASLEANKGDLKYELNKNATVEDLQKKITSTGVSTPYQQLTFEGKELKDASKALAELGIKDGSTVNVAFLSESEKISKDKNKKKDTSQENSEEGPKDENKKKDTGPKSEGRSIVSLTIISVVSAVCVVVVVYSIYHYISLKKATKRFIRQK